jgi:HSP20 family protein
MRPEFLTPPFPPDEKLRPGSDGKSTATRLPAAGMAVGLNRRRNGKGTIMNMLTKLNPFGKTETLDMMRPMFRSDAFRDMEELVRNMQRAFSGWPAQVDESMRMADWTPSVDIGESDEEYLIKAELPEVKKEDIQVHVDNGTLTISGERAVEKEDKGTRFHRVERAFGSFHRSFSMPDDTDADHITSEYRDGILTVHLPRNPVEKPKAHAIPVT